MVEVTMGELIDVFIRNWCVISYQEGLDKPEVIGPFKSQAEAQLWSSEHFSVKEELRHQVTWLLPPNELDD